MFNPFPPPAVSSLYLIVDQVLFDVQKELKLEYSRGWLLYILVWDGCIWVLI